MRYGFVTCVQLGMSCLDELIALRHLPSVLITLPDEKARDKSGRVYLDSFALRNSVPLIKTPNVNDQSVLDAVGQLELDWLFVIGWSQIAGTSLLNAPSRGVVGIHPSLLPVGRGRAAIPWAIIKGLPETGVTLFKLDEGVDTGPIIDQIQIPLSPHDTATTLYERVNDAHCRLIRQGVPRMLDADVQLRDQDDARATEWPGRRPADGEIFSSMSVVQALRLVRATCHPYPGAFTRRTGRSVLRIWAAREGPSEHFPTIELTDGIIHATVYDIEDGR